MPISRYRQSLDSSDLDLLRGVLNRICMARGLQADSAKSEAIAASLIRLWQSGRRDEDKLFRAIAPGPQISPPASAAIKNTANTVGSHGQQSCAAISGRLCRLVPPAASSRVRGPRA